MAGGAMSPSARRPRRGGLPLLAGAVLLPTPLVLPASTASTVSTSAPGSGYQPVTPTRILDSRVAGAPVGRLKPGVSRDLTVAGTASVPAGATAVEVTLTVVDPDHAGWAVAWPSGSTMPVASNLN